MKGLALEMFSILFQIPLRFVRYDLIWISHIDSCFFIKLHYSNKNETITKNGDLTKAFFLSACPPTDNVLLPNKSLPLTK